MIFGKPPDHLSKVATLIKDFWRLWVDWQLQETVWQVSERLKGLKGASGSCGPVEKERLGVAQLAAPRAGLEGFGGFEAFEGFEVSIRPQPQLLEPVWKVSEGLKRLKGLKGASGSFGPVPGGPFDREKGGQRPFGQMASKKRFGLGIKIWP